MRCYHCNKKIGVVEFDCNCNHKFCAKHRLPENHNCEFNHKKFERNKLEKKMVKVEANKIIKIT